MIDVIKIGGAVIDDAAALSALLDHCQVLQRPLIVVHGGGRRATTLAEQLGLPQTMVDGRRITDAATLEVVVMTFAGWINTWLTAQLQARGVNAIGLSGADGNVVRATKRETQDIDYGFVGDVAAVHAGVLHGLLDGGLTPVIAPITHDGGGQLLNTNADIMASNIAASLGEQVALTYVFDHAGVLRDVTDETSVIPELRAGDVAALVDSGIVTAGMRPKLDMAFAAVRAGVSSVRITNAYNLDGGTVCW